jgi:hypothetical protein
MIGPALEEIAAEWPARSIVKMNVDGTRYVPSPGSGSPSDADAVQDGKLAGRRLGPPQGDLAKWINTTV